MLRNEESGSTSSVELVQSDQLAGCLEIYTESIKKSAASLEVEAPSLDELRAYAEKINKRFPWLVYVDSREILGFAYANQFSSRMAFEWTAESTIFVREDVSGKGVGKALYTRLLEILRRQGFYSAMCGITLPGEASVKLHKAFGFEQVGLYKKVGYKLDKWHDVAWYCLELRARKGPPSPILSVTDLTVEDWMEIGKT